MRTQVFAHKNYIGIKSSPDAEGLLNKPLEKGQLGFVVDASFVDISPEALELLKKVKSSSDDLGDIDVFKSSSGKIIFSWLGGPCQIANVNEITGSNNYNPNLLKSCDSVETDPEFIEAVNDESSEK